MEAIGNHLLRRDEFPGHRLHVERIAIDRDLLGLQRHARAGRQQARHLRSVGYRPCRHLAEGLDRLGQNRAVALGVSAPG